MLNYFAHPSSVIDDGAVIGEGTSIWHFCHVMPRAIIGKGCTLGQNNFVANNVVIGNHVKIQNNVSIYDHVILEDDVFIGPSVVFTNVINPRSFIDRKAEFKKTIIRKGATIGANATIICGVEVGEYALVGAGAVVSKHILAFALAMGNPARQTGWVSEQGHRLNFDKDGNAICSGSGQEYILRNNRVSKCNSV